MRKLPRVLITGGPTRAYFDRVRYMSNLSSGELAFRLCKRLRQHRAKVAAVIGPTAFNFRSLRLQQLSSVETRAEMSAAVLKLCRSFKPDYVVFSAAVLDFEPAKSVGGKVSSKKSEWVIKLKPTPKIIDQVSKKFPKIKRVGFKLEWEPTVEPTEFGQKLLKKKKLDVLCLNYLSQMQNGKHPALLFSADGSVSKARSKQEIADWITWYIFGQLG